MSESEQHGPSGTTPERRPGRELQAARERAGIALEQMAATLHLPRDQVAALERDDYARLPPPTFVRGYLRTYARELGLDADQLVADYDAAAGAGSETEIVVPTGEPETVAGRGALVALAVVVTVVLVGALAWWLQQPALPPPQALEERAEAEAGSATVEEPASAEATGSAPRTADETGAAAGTEQAAEPVEEGITVEAEPEPVPEEPGILTGTEQTGAATAAAEEAEAEPTAAAESAAAETEGEQADAGAGAEQADAGAGAEQADAEVEAGDEEAAAPEPETTATAEERPRATSDAELVPTPAATEGPDTLVVEVDGRSWLEAYDSRGRQLAYTLYSGARPVELNGWAPFNVFLGNAPDVTLRYEGRELDLGPFIRSDNTARFRVDSEGAHQR